MQSGRRLIAGVDEAGRGPLAGPVVAGAVILPEGEALRQFAGVTDSKQLSEHAREQMYARIVKHARAYAAARASAGEIDALNIRRASLLAMKRAIEKLSPQPEYVLADGKDYPDLSVPGEAVIKGDGRCLCVGAASIVAKVVRDRIMAALDLEFPVYGFAQHKGYPTQYHRAAVKLFGPCRHHRTCYGPVRDHMLAPTPSAAFAKAMKKIEQCRRLSEFEAVESVLDEPGFDELERFYLRTRLKYETERISAASSASRVKTGGRGEDLAARMLEEKGYSIWERNYRIRGGEIDLIVNKGTLIAFIEVKTRRNDTFGDPLEGLTQKKTGAIIRAAERYLYDRDLVNEWDLRYDVVSILALKGAEPRIEHIEDAFRAEESL